MTARELAARWGISESTAYRWLARGQTEPSTGPHPTTVRGADTRRQVLRMLREGGTSTSIAEALSLTRRHVADVTTEHVRAGRWSREPAPWAVLPAWYDLADDGRMALAARLLRGPMDATVLAALLSAMCEWESGAVWLDHEVERMRDGGAVGVVGEALTEARRAMGPWWPAMREDGTVWVCWYGDPCA